MKCGGLWSSLGIGRFRCLHSLLMRAIRCANFEHSALNAGVPTDPHSPESNSSYLARIWSIMELYSLCASCTVIKKTGLGMIRSDTVNINLSNFNVEDVEDAKTRLISMKSVSELRKLLTFPAKPVKTGHSDIQDSCRQRSKERMVSYANELSGKWLEILRKLSRQKLVCEKSNSCKIQGMSKTSKIHCCMLHGLCRLFE